MATRPAPDPLITGEEIAAKVEELAGQLSKDCGESIPVFLIVLKGGLYFGADLARAMSVPVIVDFIRAESYSGEVSSGSVEIVTKPREPLAGRTVFIIEDVLDSGLTAERLVEWVREQSPGSVRLVTLLDKPQSRKSNLTPDYAGFTIVNEFVVGYGLDFNQQYRELPDIHRLIHDD